MVNQSSESLKFAPFTTDQKVSSAYDKLYDALFHSKKPSETLLDPIDVTYINNLMETDGITEK